MKLAQCLPITATPKSILPKRATGFLAMALLVYVFLWNVRTLDYVRYERFLPGSFNWIGRITGLDQIWDMFAPTPPDYGGWYVFHGKLADSSDVDVFRGGEVDWNKPTSISASYPNQRWRKYLMFLTRQEHEAHLFYLSEYLCQNWNSSHNGNETLSQIEVIFMREDVTPNLKRMPAKKQTLREWHLCHVED